MLSDTLTILPIHILDWHFNLLITSTTHTQEKSIISSHILLFAVTYHLNPSLLACISLALLYYLTITYLTIIATSILHITDTDSFPLLSHDPVITPISHAISIHSFNSPK